jgi:hypothetical protein
MRYPGTMQPSLAVSVTHRSRLIWLAGAVVTSVVAFVLARPSGPHERSAYHSAGWHCGGHHRH